MATTTMATTAATATSPLTIETRFCKHCVKEVVVVQHIRRRGLNEGYDGSDVNWDYRVGSCGHVVQDDSY